MKKLITMKNLLTSFFLLAATYCCAQTTSRGRDSTANTTGFQLKVKLASHKAAGDILSATGQAIYIIQYAQLIISQPGGEGWLLPISYGCMTNVAINDSSTDSDIQFTVNSIFTKYAKAYYRITN